jgi:hypothetical protein
MALLMPFYQLIARACWRYGLADLLDPAAWWAKWWEVTGEIRGFRIEQVLRGAAEKQSADAKDAPGPVRSPIRIEGMAPKPGDCWLIPGLCTGGWCHRVRERATVGWLTVERVVKPEAAEFQCNQCLRSRHECSGAGLS